MKTTLQWLLAAGAAAFLSSCVDNYGGGPAYGGGGYYGGGYSTGTVIETLPRGYEPLYYGGTRYYTYNGVFYRPQGNRYIIVERPRGYTGGRPGGWDNNGPRPSNGGWDHNGPRPGGWDNNGPRPGNGGWNGSGPRPGNWDNHTSTNPNWHNSSNTPRPDWNNNRPGPMVRNTPPSVQPQRFPGSYVKQNSTPGNAVKKTTYRKVEKTTY